MRGIILTNCFKDNHLMNCFYCHRPPLLCGKGRYHQVCCDNIAYCDENPCAPPGATPAEARENWNGYMIALSKRCITNNWRFQPNE